jgi:hypothetical protein
MAIGLWIYLRIDMSLRRHVLWSIKFNPLFTMINVHSDTMLVSTSLSVDVSATDPRAEEECLRPDITL